MKKTHIIFLREFFMTQMIHWFLFVVVITILRGPAWDKAFLFKWLLMSFVPLGMFVVRRYTNRFLVFMGSHTLLLLLFWLLPYAYLWERIVFGTCVTGYGIYSFCLRIKKKDRLDVVVNPVVAVVAAGLGLMMGKLRGGTEWEPYYVTSIVLILCFYFIQLYLEQYQTFILINKSSCGQIPAKEMFRSGLSLVVMFTVGASFLLLLTSGLGWFGGIVSGLKKCLIWLLKLLLGGEAKEKPPVKELLPVDPSGGGGLPEGQTQPAALWLLLEKVFTVAAVVALVALCIFGIYALVTFVYKRFRRIVADEEDLGEVTDVRQKCPVERYRSKRRPLLAGLSAREQIRRIYKREILAEKGRFAKNTGFFALKHMTARECTEILGRRSLGDVYEKARYSQEECTSEDVRRARQK